MSNNISAYSRVYTFIRGIHSVLLLANFNYRTITTPFQVYYLWIFTLYFLETFYFYKLYIHTCMLSIMMTLGQH